MVYFLRDVKKDTCLKEIREKIKEKLKKKNLLDFQFLFDKENPIDEDLEEEYKLSEIELLDDSKIYIIKKENTISISTNINENIKNLTNKKEESNNSLNNKENNLSLNNEENNRLNDESLENHCFKSQINLNQENDNKNDPNIPKLDYIPISQEHLVDEEEKNKKFNEDKNKKSVISTKEKGEEISSIKDESILSKAINIKKYDKMKIINGNTKNNDNNENLGPKADNENPNEDIHGKGKEIEQKEEELQKKEKENGIIFNKLKNEDEDKYIYIDIKLMPNIELNPKEIEIYNLENPKQEGYKFIEFEKILFSVCPIYKDKIGAIIFGLKSSKGKIDNNNIIDMSYNSNMTYIDEDGGKFQIIRDKESGPNFNIYNEPKLSKNNFLLFLEKLYYLSVYNFSKNKNNIISSIFHYDFKEIIDLIFKIGIESEKDKNFINLLITTLYSKNIDILAISQYLNQNQNKYNNFERIAPHLIYEINELYEQHNHNKEENNSLNENAQENENNDKEFLLCCNRNITNLISQKKIDQNLFENIKNKLKNNNNEIDINIKNSIKNRLEEINKEKENKISCILTEETYRKLYLLDLGIKAAIPMIIQGFTSAGKSFLSILALEINKKQYVEIVLSENTSSEDLLGRNIIKGNSIKFCPGVLLDAYIQGKTVILNECDLAKPEILSCIVGTLTKNELIVSNSCYYKNDNFNLILTMNGEVKGFSEKQRKIMPYNIISKFIIIYFDEIGQQECEKIFMEQIKNVNKYDENIKSNFIKLHNKMNKIYNEKQNNLEKYIEPIVTLRNLKYCQILGINNIPQRFAAEIAYTSRFSDNERKKDKELMKILDNFGPLTIDEKIKSQIKEKLDDFNILYDDNYLTSFYLAKIACENGFHTLLIGKDGCGLTTFAKNLQRIVYNKNDKKIENNYLLCNYETTTEDLIGCQKPFIDSKNGDLSDIIKWKDGPILKGIKNEGSPVILDNINYSKTQILECLNSLLENNFKSKNNYKFPIIQNFEDKEINIGKNFVIIGTMKDEENKNISKSLINRFVSIYLNEININANNIKILIKKTIKKFNEKDKTKEQNFDILYDKLYGIDKISEETLNELIKLFEEEGKNLLMKKKNLKQIIRLIQKLALLYEKLKKYKKSDSFFTMKDCYNLLEFNFNKIENNKNDFLITNFMNEGNKNKDFFFEEKDGDNNNEKSDAWKMIMSLIICDLSNTTIFLQGKPGSGKTCAAKYYGANRKLKNRDPIISINCHRDLSLENLLGDYCFKNGKFEFIKGPLLNAVDDCVPILLDEFNLCSESFLMDLSPIIKASIYDKIYLKGYDEPIVIKPGFLIIATGNFENEKGRKPIPLFLSDEIKIQKIESEILNEVIINKILKNQYEDLCKYISSSQIKEIFEYTNKITKKQFSLRQIRCLLERIKRFINCDVFTEQEKMDFKELNENDYKKTIPIIYIIISYIIPQLRIKNIEELLIKFNEILKYNNEKELKEFIKKEVDIKEFTSGKKETNSNKIRKLKVITKGKIYLKINENFKGDFPQNFLETYFWIRMTCRASSDEPQDENILLSGETCYKNYLLKKWLNFCYNSDRDIYDIINLTKNSETQDLIGVSSLDSKEQIQTQIVELKKFLPEEKNTNNDQTKYCINYIQNCIDKLETLKESFNNKTKSNSLGNSVFSFHLGPLTKGFLFGKKLIIKGIENPHPSVIERLNPILENPRNLVLFEDNLKIFNDQNILDKVYTNPSKNKSNDNSKESKKTSIPLDPKFSIFFTTKDIHNDKLSEALKSRLTEICCSDYKEDKEYFIKLCSNIFYEDDQEDLINKCSEIFNLKEKLEEKIKIVTLKFIRWCKSTLNIYKNIKKNNYKTELFEENEIKFKYIVGIAALRSIIDSLDNNKREEILSEKYIEDYLPKKLYKLLREKKNFNFLLIVSKLMENILLFLILAE